jgi:hypothetical protein
MAKQTAEAVKRAAEDRAAEAKATGQRAAEASGIADALASVTADLERVKARQAKLAAIGDERLTYPYSHLDPRFGITVEMEPARSVLTGAELAEREEARIAGLEAEVERLRDEIAGLLVAE